MPEPALDRRERHAGIISPRAGLAPQIVEVQVQDLRAPAREPPCRLERHPTPPHFVTKDASAGKGSPAGSFLRASKTARSTVETGARRGFFAFVFLAGRNRSPRTCSHWSGRSSPRRQPVSSAAIIKGRSTGFPAHFRPRLSMPGAQAANSRSSSPGCRRRVRASSRASLTAATVPTLNGVNGSGPPRTAQLNIARSSARSRLPATVGRWRRNASSDSRVTSSARRSPNARPLTTAFGIGPAALSLPVTRLASCGIPRAVRSALADRPAEIARVATVQPRDDCTPRF